MLNASSTTLNKCMCMYINLFFLSYLSTGIDELMAKHIAHLFIRDPISLFAEKLEQDVENESDHFEVCLSFSPLINMRCLSN